MSGREHRPMVKHTLCAKTLMAKNAAQKLLSDIGLSEDFIDRLIHDNDWSMIIKLHALFEAVLASLVVKKLQVPEIRKAVSHLEFNHAESGKVAFALALDLIGAKDATFLRGLSELRNDLVHDVQKINFDLRAYTSQLDPNQRKKFKSQFGKSICAVKNGESAYNQLLKAHPAHIVLLAAYSCLLTLEFKMSYAKRDLLVQVLMERVLK